MTIIKQNSNVVTQVNVVKVDPQNQQRVLDLMIEQAQAVMSTQPGFISINIHKSLDGTQIVNYVQWANTEQLDAAHRTPEFQTMFEKYKDLQLEAGPYIYEVAYINEVPS